MDHHLFYIELGRLLYAIAKSDGMVQREEWERVIRIVRDELSPLEESLDEYGMDNAFYTEFEFERLVDAQSSVKDAFMSFVSYAKENLDSIPTPYRHVILRAVEKVALAYGGMDETEMALVTRLRSLLQD